jgi:hypothetical protein
MATEESAFVHEAKAPLPDGLQLLALEYAMRDDLGELLSKDHRESHKRDKVNWFPAIRQCLTRIGESACAPTGTATIFGVKPYWRLRCDILPKPEVIQRWQAKAYGNADMLRAIGIEPQGPADRGKPHLKFLTSKLLSDFSHRSQEPDVLWDFEVPVLCRVWPEFYDEREESKAGDFTKWSVACACSDIGSFDQVDRT